MSLRRNLPVPLRQTRTFLNRRLPAFVRPYLLLILGAAILLSFVLSGADFDSNGEPDVGLSLRRAESGGLPSAAEGRSRLQSPVQLPDGAPTQAPEGAAAAEDPVATATPLPTDTPSPTPTALPSPTPAPAPLPDIADLQQTINVLVLGSDQRPDAPNWRTDVIILLMMNPYLGEAAIISFPRDMYIDRIPGHLPNRINVVDYLGELDSPGGGGPRLLIDILEDRLGIFIDHYVRFRFDGFVSVIDALGGLKIHIDCHLYEQYPEENIYLNLPPGEHVLTGRQALSYVRSRKSGGGDLDRARRQQRVVWALRKQLVEENLITRLFRLRQLYEALRYSVDTDVGLIDALRFARFGLALDEAGVKGMVLSTPHALRPGWRQGMSVFLVDWDFVAAELFGVFSRAPLVETNTAVHADRPQPDAGVSASRVEEARPECP